MKKKLVALLLCIVLMAGVLPLAASAEETVPPRPDPNAEVFHSEPVLEYNPIYIDVFTPDQFEPLPEK